MKISRNNYEPFFIDYLEGNLDEKMVDDFIEFLQQNPDLKEELSLFETVSIGHEEITFNKKELLFKEKFDAENEFNQAAIASLEGEISASEKTEFENYLYTHPEKQKEVELFNKTKLRPDQTIVFGRKNELYRRSTGRTVLLWTSRVAAVLIVALTVYFFIENTSNNPNPENQLVTIEPETGKSENLQVVKDAPVKTENQEVPETVKEEPVTPTVKKKGIKPTQTKIIRENPQGRLLNDDFALRRMDEAIPVPLKTITASFSVQLPEAELVPVKLARPIYNEPVLEERLLVDVVKEKTGFEKLNFSKITKAGLTFVANLSSEKLNYETNKEGKVTEVSFDSRLLAFSFPTRTVERE
ncbi:MAG: hypothetical protein FD181_1170 [Prolixibacteraceae bacterium]|nr:MAG: hypothetical protein FD181_1170 [Prolixibacteraceae bacterium]